MSNSFKVIDYITKECTRLAHEKLSFIATVDKQYDDAFKDNGQGKKGSVIRVRRPNAYVRRKNSLKMDVQDTVELSDSFTLATVDGVDMKFNHQELIQSVNSDAAFDDFSSKYIEPAVSVLVSGIEADFLEFATKQTYNLVGTAGNAINSITVPALARARLNKCLAPKDNRSIQVDSSVMAAIVGGTPTYFNPANDVSKAFREGFFSRTQMADFYENERVWTMTTGDDAAGAIDTAADGEYSQGMTSINIDALGTTLYAGQVFTWADMYACHPETKQPYPYLQQFVITAAPTVAGNEATVTFSPAIYTTGARKNVCTNTGADITLTHAAQNNKVVTFVGAVSSSYIQTLMYQKEAFQFVTADLPLMDDAHKCMRKAKDGLSIRVWQGSDIVNGELLMRLDIMYGWAALNPQWACRLIGSANT
jgi:hypothetical protein